MNVGPLCEVNSHENESCTTASWGNSLETLHDSPENKELIDNFDNIIIAEKNHQSFWENI